MNPLKRVVLEACVWLGGNDPRDQQMPKDHSWLVPGPSFLNTLIDWAHATPVVLVPVAVTPPVKPRR
jgi:hypothetical protein